MENLDKLINELRHLPNETPWLEFKCNNYTPDTIGENISALANGAALYEKNFAYMIWGINDTTHEIVGTDYDLQTLKKGNQEIQSWLRNMLSLNADFEFYSVQINEKRVGILIIHAASNTPVTFQKNAYMKVGSYTKKLNAYPQIEKQLWDRLNNRSFEEGLAKYDLELFSCIQFLDISTYFDMRQIPQPSDFEGVAHYLKEEGIIIKQDNGLYAITNLGAILLAKNLEDFPRLSRKAIRVVQYEGNCRLNMQREDVGVKGYAADFSRVINYIEALIPSAEPIYGASRDKKMAYPLLAIRESIASALIHQDFSITGTGPTVEIFSNRMEIINPGLPLVDVKRIIDNPPKSRNEKLASLMRKFRLCEELGSGWDKILLSCELAQLPAPKIDLYDENMKVTLFSEIPFASIPGEDRLRACYLHACIKYVQGEQLSNSSLRGRFGLPVTSSGSISRLIKEAVHQKLIKPLDANTAPKHMKYIPFWA